MNVHFSWATERLVASEMEKGLPFTKDKELAFITGDMKVKTNCKGVGFITENHTLAIIVDI